MFWPGVLEAVHMDAVDGLLVSRYGGAGSDDVDLAIVPLDEVFSQVGHEAGDRVPPLYGIGAG